MRNMLGRDCGAQDATAEWVPDPSALDCPRCLELQAGLTLPPDRDPWLDEPFTQAEAELIRAQDEGARISLDALLAEAGLVARFGLSPAQVRDIAGRVVAREDWTTIGRAVGWEPATLRDWWERAAARAVLELGQVHDALTRGGADARVTAHNVSGERRYLVEWCGSRVYHGPDLDAALRALAGCTAAPPGGPQ